LTKRTWEGKGIKRVQEALSEYNSNPDRQRLRALKRRCDEWDQRHPVGSDSSDRARRKRTAMDTLKADIAEESIRYEGYRHPIRKYKAKRGRQRYFGDVIRDYDPRDHHRNQIELVTVRNDFGVNLHTYREWVAGPPPQREGDLRSEGTQEALDMAYYAVRSAREMLPLGPLNNREDLHPDILRRERYPRWIDTLIDLQMEAFVANGNDIVQHRRRIPPGEDFVLQQACLAHAVWRYGGGVCSKIAALTLGILTKEAEPGTRLAQVYHQLNHEFVLVAYGDSPWIVADPWTHNSYVIPLDYCSFGEEDEITRHMFVTVHRKSRHMFGVTLNLQRFASIMDRTEREMPAKDETFESTFMNFGEEDNLERRFRGADNYLAANARQWGPRVFD
jgi:hypothetical protein